MFGEEMKSLTEDIEASYEARKAAISALAQETHHFLGTFQQQHEAMARALKANFVSETEERSAQTQALLNRFAHECEAQAATLKSDLASFRTRLSREVVEMRGEFAADHQQARAAWQHHARTKGKKQAGRS